MELFSLFFDDEVFSHIVTETNAYAQQCFKLANTSTMWHTTASEIRAYIEFQIRDYWTKDEKLHYDPIASRISCNRFEEISRYLHFADNSQLPARGEQGYSRLQKVQPIISATNQRCLSLYRPNVQNSIDEAMIPFKGMCIECCCC